jgi:AcrR family transcriptional regulator
MITKTRVSRKKQIEKEATRLFQSKGYAGSSMRDLASVLGIEAASLYSHVKSKEEILQGICFRIASAFLEGLRDITRKGKPVSQMLHDLIIMHCNVMTHDVSASAVFWNEWKHLSGTSRDEFIKMKEEYENRFIKIIDEGIEKEEFRKMNSKFAAMAILSSLNCIHVWYKPDGPLTSEEVGEELSRILLTGIRKLK